MARGGIECVGREFLMSTSLWIKFWTSKLFSTLPTPRVSDEITLNMAKALILNNLWFSFAHSDPHGEHTVSSLIYRFELE